MQFTEVVGGKRNTVPVCEACARDRGIVARPSEGAMEPDAPPHVASISVQVTANVDPRSLPTAPRRCPGCNTSLVEIRKSGRVGCPACYTAFREHLEPLLQRVHGATRHVTARDDAEAREKLHHLQVALRRAVDEEDFEAAARLRDQIETARARMEAEGNG